MDLGYVSSVSVKMESTWFPHGDDESRYFLLPPLLLPARILIVMGRARMYIHDGMGVAEEEADDMNWRAVLSSSFLHVETVRQ